MKKIFTIALSIAIVAALGTSCHKKAAATPGAAAKRYTEHIMNDNYDALVKAIVFTDTPANARTATKPAVKKSTQKAIDTYHATTLRTIHHPDVTARGGIKEVKVVSEKMHPDNKICDVVVSNTYNNGLVEQVAYKMVNHNNQWKIRVNDDKEVWSATTSEGDRETIKIREDKERDFVKDIDNGERQFVKDIVRRDGQVEVIKTREDGQRHREVIK